MWKLTDMAAAEIAALEEDGVKVTPQAVLHIQQLTLDIVSPVDGVSLAKGLPVTVGNVRLWPLTIAAHCFFSEAEALPELRGGWALLDRRRTRLRVFALAYAMANGHDPTRVGVPPDLRIIRRWARGLCCRFEDLAEAVNEVFGDGAKPIERGRKPEPKDARRNVAAMAQEAAIMCGGTPEYWEFQVSIPYVAEIIKRAARLKAEFAGAESKADIEPLRRLAIFTDNLRAEAAEAKAAENGEHS